MHQLCLSVRWRLVPVLPFTVRKTLISCRNTLSKYNLLFIVYKGCVVAGPSHKRPIPTERKPVQFPRPSHPPLQSGTMYKYSITCRIEQLKLIDVHDRLGVITKRKKKTRRGKRAGGKKKTVSICSKCTIIIFNARTIQ